MENKNMELWNSVCETDPTFTKPVTFGRGFTAIDPMYQIRSATEQFGPAGRAWGWEIKDTKFLPTDYVAVLVSLTFGNFCVEQWGQCGLFIDSQKQKPDADCMKKATTDGITKCLSYLGFNADVFLGRFDDNKYVEEMRSKYGFGEKQKLELIGEISECETHEELDAVVKRAEGLRDKMDKQMQTLIGNEFTKKRSFLGNRELDRQMQERMAAE